MIMVINDTILAVLFASVMWSAWEYVRKAKTSMEQLPDDMMIRKHFRVHTIAVIGFLLSASLGCLFAVLHLLSQNIFGYPPETVIEYGSSIALIGILLSAKAYIIHAEDEETPDNAFYIGRGK